MTVEALILEQAVATRGADISAGPQNSSDHGSALAELNHTQLEQHIHTLQQKLARQKAKHDSIILNQGQQQQLIALLERSAERDSITEQLQGLVQRATELNQQSEQIQQDIQGLHIVSENATNKCYEITYGAQHVIDQNKKIQKNLAQQLDGVVGLHEQCEQRTDELSRHIESSCQSQQRMDSSTNRAQLANQKSKTLLEELNRCKEESLENIKTVRQVTQVSKKANDESENLKQSLLRLRQQIGDKIDEHQVHMEASKGVLASCRQMVKEVVQGKQDTDRVLIEVSQTNTESEELVGKMSDLLQEGEKKQQLNRNLNLELQHSLQRNQQQREELTILTNECREVRDEYWQSHEKNEATLRESLNNISVTLEDSKQSRLQVDRVLKEVVERNRDSENLIEHMHALTKTADAIQQKNTQLNHELQQILRQSNINRDELVELIADCRVVRDKTESVLVISEQINSDSQINLSRLNDYMDTMCETKEELNELIVLSKKINGETGESLESMRTNINNSTLIQKESMRLNKESVATTLEAKRATEKLAEELESSSKLNEHYRDRLKQAEKKYLNATEAELKYQELYKTSLKALEENAGLLEEARATLKDCSDNSSDYNNTVKQFQHSTVQSQQIILETQASIKSLLSNNEQLTQENRFLTAQLQQREPSAPASLWSSLEPELQSDASATSGVDNPQDEFGLANEDWRLDR